MFAQMGLADIVLSWSLEDIFDEDLYTSKVEEIPGSFVSVGHYMESYKYPLLEETRGQLCSSLKAVSTAPFADVIAVDECKPLGSSLYDLRVEYWRNTYCDHGKKPYKTLPGDLLIVTDAKPETASDLQRVGRVWTFATVTNIMEDEDEDAGSSVHFKINASNGFEVCAEMQKSLLVIFLINIVPNERIWEALHMSGNSEIIKQVLCRDSVTKLAEDCNLCSQQGLDLGDNTYGMILSSQLNDSQNKAVLSCLHKIYCQHKSFLELIWGPPGTGKTKTVSMMLCVLRSTGKRVLACGPTRTATKKVASHVVRLLKEPDNLFCSLGDVLMFHSKEQLTVDSRLQEICLDYRVQRLSECLAPLTGWRHCFSSMIDLLQNCSVEYHIFLDKKLMAEKGNAHENGKNIETEESNSLLDFIRKRFSSSASALRKCVSVLCTHVPKCYLLECNFQNLVALVKLVDSFQNLLFQDNILLKELEKVFSTSDIAGKSKYSLSNIACELQLQRSQCLSLLKGIQDSLDALNLPNARSVGCLKEFCFQRASLIFCTASSSYELHSLHVQPLDVVVIDEAAQLKECETTIPLQLTGIRHAVLVGDEHQLPATVKSRVSDGARYGRSLFERLSSLGHSKHLLNIQYRMHPSISFFPNSRFYSHQIIDGPNVKTKSYEKHYLPGPMFGSYSFINIMSGREELVGTAQNQRNMVEVAIVVKIVKDLYKAWEGKGSTKRLGVGVISPYAAQVAAIRGRLGHKYENPGGFIVKVNSVDGFQGGEEDIIVISTVRSSKGGPIEFLSSPQETNVALTRARHSLWILGNGRTLANSNSVWETLVRNAKDRNCFFNAVDDEGLGKAILQVKKEFDQLDDMLNPNSDIFQNARWKVTFSDDFRKSFRKLQTSGIRMAVINCLLKLASGWRPKKRNVELPCAGSSHVIKQFKVEGLYIICTIDIVKETRYVQILKVWDVLPLEDIRRLVERLSGLFASYTEDFINRCKEKYIDKDLEVPMSWPTFIDIVRYKNRGNDECTNDPRTQAVDFRCYAENTKVSESLLLMKFYPLSSHMVSHLLSDYDGGVSTLPFEVTDEEREIIQIQRSSFILGRSGTGKTTVLTMKLFEKELIYDRATEGFSGDINDINKGNNSEDYVDRTKGTVLRQIFVTVSPKLCYAVKQHVSQLKSFACSGKYSAESSSTELDVIDHQAQFKDIPDSFCDIPPNLYPLVITFRKFLIMLDAALGDSFFLRFREVREMSYEKVGSLGSVSLHTLLAAKEVDYDRFSSFYWPHFNNQLTKKVDSSRAFTEIISHIKGGMKLGETCDGRLSRHSYIQLSDGRVSTLSHENREIVYDIFQEYEKMKVKKGEFDLSDFVNDLHGRVKTVGYEGDQMDFVYIDEVQDLTMKQIALFKHICRNVDEGFVFSGDTAQTIARGIDFRFEDIRSLFYNEFILNSGANTTHGRCEKGHISKTLHLSHNFRTHDGILKLAQSVIDILYRFFPLFVDVLSPETSLIYGEAPILLECGSEENAIVKIFGNCNAGGNFVGFGAEQAIIVRDDSNKREVSRYVGKQALVLTIIECKGLEFQDVLLYNFFDSSPLRNKWRVIYEYMKDENLLDANSSISSKKFDPAEHNLLCSELKLLYVAITRTRQRLWICENGKDFSTPILEYWKKLCVVQVRTLDESMAQAMQVASTPEEWRSRGYKLLHEGNYEIATMCFERAGDKYGENLSKATGLKASADRMHLSNPEAASVMRREAAEIFYSIGQFQLAAECFYILNEYERAGRIYLEKCGKSELDKAGECFSLAGNYKLAAEVYARGDFFLKCLNMCKKGKLFDKGLNFINFWRQKEASCKDVGNRYRGLEDIELEFLESCAFHYYKLGDKWTMMKYVKRFPSIAVMRTFLEKLGCLEELLKLEEQYGNFIEAAKIAKLLDDILLEADLLGKAQHFKEASMLILRYALSNSLWGHGSNGWPLKQFEEEEKLLAKAKSFAKEVSVTFYEFVSLETNILLNKLSSLSEMGNWLKESRKCNSIRGVMVSTRKILDAVLCSKIHMYTWEDELIADLVKNSEEIISKNQVAISAMVHFWEFWRDKVLNIFEYLKHVENLDPAGDRHDEEFCFSYLGVRKNVNILNSIYILLNSDAYWLREVDRRYLQRNGKMVSIDVQQFVGAARSYWCSELLSVGMKVLENLEALYIFSIKNHFSLFRKCRCLLYIYGVAQFLLGFKILDYQYQNEYHKKLKNLVNMATRDFFDYAFPLDLRESASWNMISLRGTDAFKELAAEVLSTIINLKGNPSYGQIGRASVMIFGSEKLDMDLCRKFLDRFDDNTSWNIFFEYLIRNLKSRAQPDSVPECSNDPSRISPLFEKFHYALEETYNVNWRNISDYISPGCFLYLLERLVTVASLCRGCSWTTRTSFVEWFICQEANSALGLDLAPNAERILDRVLEFVIQVVWQLLFRKNETVEWLKRSGINVKVFYPLVAWRLVAIVYLICINFGKGLDLLLELLGRNDITGQLPWNFHSTFSRRSNFIGINTAVIAESFKKIDNPLVYVTLGPNFSKLAIPDAIFINLKADQRREEVYGVLFPELRRVSQRQDGVADVEGITLSNQTHSQKGCDQKQLNPSSESNSEDVQGLTSANTDKFNIQVNDSRFWETLEELKSLGSYDDLTSFIPHASTMKVTVDEFIVILHDMLSSRIQKNRIGDNDENFCVQLTTVVDELKQLSAALDGSKMESLDDVNEVEKLSGKLLSKRPTVESFLNHSLLRATTNDMHEPLGTDGQNSNVSSDKTEIIGCSDQGGKAQEPKATSKIPERRKPNKKGRKGKAGHKNR